MLERCKEEKARDRNMRPVRGAVKPARELTLGRSRQDGGVMFRRGEKRDGAVVGDAPQAHLHAPAPPHCSAAGSSLRLLCAWRVQR